MSSVYCKTAANNTHLHTNVLLGFCSASKFVHGGGHAEEPGQVNLHFGWQYPVNTQSNYKIRGKLYYYCFGGEGRAPQTMNNSLLNQI